MNDNTQAKNSAMAGFFGILTILLIYSVFWGPIKKYSDSLYVFRTVNVSAEGKAFVSPDVAKLSFSVISEGANPDRIAEENNAKINKAIDFVKSQGVDEKDIKTTSYNLSPRYEYDEKTRKTFISGYTLTQEVSLKARDISKTGKILAGLPPLGINQIGSITFDVDDPEKSLAEARKQAFEKAAVKANAMAEANNVKLGDIVNFSEYQGGPIPYYAADKAMGMGGGPIAAPTAPSIQPGTQEITVNVSVTYELR